MTELRKQSFSRFKRTITSKTSACLFYSLFSLLILLILFHKLTYSHLQSITSLSLPTSRLNSTSPYQPNSTTPSTRKTLPPPPPPPTTTPNLREIPISKLPPNLYRVLLQNPKIRHTGPPTSETRYLVWTCPPKYCAGLGDRFRGIVFVYILSIITNRRFVIQWPKNNPAPLTEALVPNQIPWNVSVGKKGGNSKDLITLPWFNCEGKQYKCKNSPMPHVDYLPVPPKKGNIRKWSVKRGRKYVSFRKDDMKKVFGERRVVRLETRLFFKYEWYLGNPYFLPVSLYLREALDEGVREVDVQREIMKWLFLPSEGVRKKLKEFEMEDGDGGHEVEMDKREGEKKKKGYVGVHARLGGDFGEDRDQRFRGVNRRMEQLPGKVLECLKRQGRDSGSIFLASDSYKFKQVFRRKMKGTKWRVKYKNERAMHVGYPTMYQPVGSRQALSNSLAKGANRVLKKVSSNKKHRFKVRKARTSQLISGADLEKAKGPFQDIFVDLLMLGNADTIVATGGSGFTKVATLLGKAENITSDVRRCGVTKTSWG